MGDGYLIIFVGGISSAVVCPCSMRVVTAFALKSTALIGMFLLSKRSSLYE